MIKTDEFSDNVAKNNSRIARNTLMLYVRMACVISINFFTTREVLFALGVENFGIVNVVGGVVSMFQFLNGMLSSAISRYLNFYLGCGDYDGLLKIFNLIRKLNWWLIGTVIFLCETLGSLIFFHYLDLPAQTTQPAYVFFQFSIFTFAANIATTPYTSLVISRENMKVFSILSVLETLLKLIIVYALYLDIFPRLEFYGGLLLAVSLAHFAFYFVICRKKYPETSYCHYWDKSKARELLSFGGWNFFGSVSGLFTDVLINILLNNFFGIIVNAARGVAVQLANAVNSFTMNFMTATRPQIIKYWASDNRLHACNLTMKSSKFCYYLLLFFVMPAMIEMDFLLHLWLGEVPQYAFIFAELIMVRLLIDSFSIPFITLIQSTGNVALYQSVVGLTLCATLPISYLVFTMGFPPESVFIVSIGISILTMFERLFLLRRQTGFLFGEFMTKVLCKSLFITLFAAIIPVFVHCMMQFGIYRFVTVVALSLISFIGAVWFIGLDIGERDYAQKILFKVFAALRRYIGKFAIL